MEKQNSCYLEGYVCKWHVEQIHRAAGRKFPVSPRRRRPTAAETHPN